MSGGTIPSVRASLHFERLADEGIQRSYRAGTILIQEGEQGDTLYLVRSGRVRVYVAGSGDRELTLASYGPGSYLGELALDGGPRSASVITLTTPTVCSAVSRAALLDYIGRHPEFAFEMLSLVIRRTRLATERARSIALLDVYGRVSRLLNELAEPRSDGERQIPDRLTQQDIASRVGASREMISKILKGLAEGGFIAIENRLIVIRKRLPAGW